MQLAVGKASTSAKLYNAFTSLTANILALGSPARAARYRYHRDLYRTYVAGELTGSNQNFRPRPKSADADSKRTMQTIIGRCRDQAQNNPSVRGGIRRIVNNAVRSGIRPQFQFRDKGDKLDTATNRAWEKLFSRWAGYADISGHDSFWAQQRLGLGHMWFDGGFFIHRVWDTSIPGVVPLRLELLERDHLDTSMDGVLKNGNIARQGKELDPRTGKVVAYHLFPEHPGDSGYTSMVQQSIRIPASEIVDVFERDRISQYHGIPWIVAVVMEAYDLEDYRAYERIGAKLAAAFGIFVKSNYADMGHPGIGIQAGETGENSNWPTTWDNMPEYIDPGRIQAVPYGADITIASHNRPGTQYEPYVKESRRTQSTGFGMSYEAYANDYTDASYSSARSASLEERLSYGGMQMFLNEKMNRKVAAWFIEAAWMAGLAPCSMPGFRTNPWPYLEAVSHQNPGWGWVEPLKDSQASGKKIDKVLSTYRREAAAQGYDWDELVDEAIDCEAKLTPLLQARAQNQQLSEQSNAEI
ncbi:phage portal protein [Desulfogranum japonicum]|uniref:phage portal protein n=1 Tax=Desulfogranum japonicum TaxID=231447 RepID=UPI0003F84520|nr:phage portal protein [Desulfogranum japonicum]